MTEQEFPPAWGQLIEDARKALRPKVSARQAAERAGISEGRWRQITKGYQATAGGRIPVPGPVDTLARMARVVGVAPEQMAAAGRDDVAKAMSSTLLRRLEVDEHGALWTVKRSAEVEALRQWLAAGDLDAGAPPTSALSLWEHRQLLDAASAKHEDEVTFLKHIFETARGLYNRSVEGGDGDAEDDLSARRSAPTSDVLDEAAHDDERDIEDEQGHDEFP